MKTPLLVKVEDHHIKEGKPGDTMGCALYLAIKEQVPKEDYVIVGSFMISVGNVVAGNYENLMMPDDMYKWRLDFDNGKEVKPASFTVPR